MKMNKKGFTLVELLGVIVILAIVLSIAIPAVAGYINNSRRESFSTVMHEYADAVGRLIVSEHYQAPNDKGSVTIISLDLIQLDKGKKESSYSSEWIKNKSYVAVVNTGTSEKQKFEYYVAAQDEKGHAIPLMNVKDITRDQVIGNAKNKMEVTIQAFCGTEDGKKYNLSTIKGLETVQQTNDQNQKINWSATIYSSNDCAS